MDETTRALFVGRKAGDVIDMPNGSIVVDEAYAIAEAQGNA